MFLFLPNGWACMLLGSKHADHGRVNHFTIVPHDLQIHHGPHINTRTMVLAKYKQVIRKRDSVVLKFLSIPKAKFTEQAHVCCLTQDNQLSRTRPFNLKKSCPVCKWIYDSCSSAKHHSHIGAPDLISFLAVPFLRSLISRLTELDNREFSLTPWKAAQSLLAFLGNLSQSHLLCIINNHLWRDALPCKKGDQMYHGPSSHKTLGSFGST